MSKKKNAPQANMYISGGMQVSFSFLDHNVFNLYIYFWDRFLLDKLSNLMKLVLNKVCNANYCKSGPFCPF